MGVSPAPSTSPQPIMDRFPQFKIKIKTVGINGPLMI